MLVVPSSRVFLFLGCELPRVTFKAVASCRGALVLALGAFASIGYPAFAQQPDSPLEVTIDNPLPAEFSEAFAGSIEELSPQKLTESGFISTDSILDRIPNVTWSGGTSRPRFLFIRGIGDLDQYAGSGLPAVTVLSDGLNFSGLANGLSLFDTHVARFERGPTGYFGGPSSLAGLVSFESALNEFDGAAAHAGADSIVESVLGTGGVWRVGARSLFGIGEHAGSLAIERTHQDGFLRNAYLGRADTNHQDTATAKVGYRAQWNSRDVVTFHALTRQNDDGYDAFTIDNTRTVRSDKPGADDLGLTGASAASTLFVDDAVRFDLEVATLRANSTYSYDGDWGNADFWFPNVPYDYFSITERDRHVTTAGAKITGGSESNSLAQLGFYFQRLTEGTAQQDFAEDTVYRTLESDFTDKRFALHGALSQMFSSSVRVWLAMRVEHQEVALSAPDQAQSKNFTAPLFQMGIEHYVEPRTKAFLKGSRGWRGGGFNVGAAVPTDRDSYDPEYLTEVSLGVRRTFADQRSFLEISAFRAFRYDQQVRLELQTDPNDPLSFVYVTDNAARGDTIGLEASSSISLSPQLRIEPSLALLDASFSRFDGGRLELDGRDAALSPSWRINIDARYQIAPSWFARAGLVSTDRYYFDDANDAQSGSISLLNGSVGYQSGSWSIVVWGQNLLDRRYPVRGFFFGNEPPDFTPKRYIQRGTPLCGGITLSYSF